MPKKSSIALRDNAFCSPRQWMKSILSILASSILLTSIANAETRYITDQLTLNLRSGPTTGHRITRTLSSGTAVTIDTSVPAENGHVFVKLRNGAEGWVLEQYLQAEPIARTKVAKLTKENEELIKKVDTLESKLSQTADNLDTTASKQSELSQLVAEKDSELQKIRSLSANAIEIDQRNAELTETNQNLLLEIDKLKAENDRLSGSSQRTQWITGGGLVLIGLFSAWLFGTFSGRKKSSWS